jgi:hypothetical protein
MKVAATACTHIYTVSEVKICMDKYKIKANISKKRAEQIISNQT